MIGMVLLASFTPQWGKSGGVLHGDQVANIGIAIVFFLNGLGLSTANLRQGASRWKVHVFVQLCTFVAFPLVWLLLRSVVSPWMSTGLALGFCYLAALPSTVSSSVAMTAIARGNVPVAIFNATLSSLIGIVLTPLLISLMAGHASGGALSFGDAVIGIAKQLLLPFVLGQLLRPLLLSWYQKHKTFSTMLDRWVILILVYNAFCDSVASGLWHDNGLDTIAIALLGAALFLFLALISTRWAAKTFHFNTEDEIAAVFCASKKTLASGVPMAKLLFGAHPYLGLILLPIMLYHQLQIFVCSIMANRYASRKD